MGARKVLLFLIAGTFGALHAKEPQFELVGQVEPQTRAAVYLHSATSPFSVSTAADWKGRFRFRRLPAGAYTLAVIAPKAGESHQTIEIGPSLADGKGRITVQVRLQEWKMDDASAVRRGAMISARVLSIPDNARREYAEALKALALPDVPAAIAHLRRAVEIAPQFAEAWNHLGTIAYQTRDFAEAERCFRQALDQDPAAFEPLVNLGGALLALNQTEEALKYNTYAVISRPNDALAQSQLGMSYLAAGNLELAQKHLELATQLDPAHFSHPQLMLAEIYLRRKQPKAAAGELEEFLKYHPDAPNAEKIKSAINKLMEK